jgi:transposase
MDVLHKRCCGLDVHKDTVVACLVTPEGKERRTFRTTTSQLRLLVEWLKESDCWHVAMESTGVYWKPVYNLFELAGINAMVVNARHMKAVPGRKTDVKDAEWICDLLQHGLLRGSFIPDRSQRELQELIRYRTGLVRERTREVNRIQKSLEGANLKIKGTAVSDVLGVSARSMIEAIIAGESDPVAIAGQVRTQLKATPEAVAEAVEGLVGEHQRYLLKLQFDHVDFLNGKISEIEAQIDKRMRPFEKQLAEIDKLPGFGRVSAQEVVASIGVDMAQFPSANHLSSWAKVCPGSNESAGKRGQTSTGKGNPYLRRTLVEAAWASVRCKKPNYFKSQYYHLKPRIGKHKAIIAVAHSMLVTIYHLLKTGKPYEELGGSYFDDRNKEAAIRQAVRRLERLGKHVVLLPAA